MNTQLKTHSTTAYDLPPFSVDSLGQAIGDRLLSDRTLPTGAFPSAGRGSECRRFEDVAFAIDLPVVRDAWNEIQHGFRGLVTDTLRMARSTTTARELLLWCQSERDVREMAQNLAAAWGCLAQARNPAPAFEQETELHVRMPPKKTVPAAAVVIGRCKANPNPVLDL